MGHDISTQMADLSERMDRYLAQKEQLERLRSQLETARQSAPEVASDFEREIRRLEAELARSRPVLGPEQIPVDVADKAVQKPMSAPIASRMVGMQSNTGYHVASGPVLGNATGSMNGSDKSSCVEQPSDSPVKVRQHVVKRPRGISLTESDIGRYGVGFLAAVLVFFAVVAFVRMFWNSVPDAVKFMMVVLPGTGIAAFGWHKTDTVSRNKLFFTAIAATGGGVVFLGFVAGAMSWNLYPSFVAGLLLFGWFAGHYMLSRQYGSIFAYGISYVGATVAIALSCGDVSATLHDLAMQYERVTMELSTRAIALESMVCGLAAAVLLFGFLLPEKKVSVRILRVLYAAASFFVLTNFSSDLWYVSGYVFDDYVTIHLPVYPVSAYNVFLVVYAVLELERAVTEEKCNSVGKVGYYIGQTILLGMLSGECSAFAYNVWPENFDIRNVVSGVSAMVLMACVILFAKNKKRMVNCVLVSMLVPMSFVSSGLFDYNSLLMCAWALGVLLVGYRFGYARASLVTLVIAVAETGFDGIYGSVDAWLPLVTVCMASVAIWTAVEFCSKGILPDFKAPMSVQTTGVVCQGVLMLRFWDVFSKFLADIYQYREQSVPKCPMGGVFLGILGVFWLRKLAFVMQDAVRSDKECSTCVFLIGSVIGHGSLYLMGFTIFGSYHPTWTDALAWSGAFVYFVCLFMSAWNTRHIGYCVGALVLSMFDLWVFGSVYNIPSIVASALGILIAAIFVWTGFVVTKKVLRIMGLILMLLHVLKITFVDMPGISGSGISVVTLLAAGIACFCISFLYGKLENVYGTESKSE